LLVTTFLTLFLNVINIVLIPSATYAVIIRRILKFKYSEKRVKCTSTLKVKQSHYRPEEALRVPGD
jgi:hypothetical protein